LVQSVKRFGRRVTLPVKDTYPGPYWAADSVLPVAVPAQTGTAWLQAGLSLGVGAPLQRKPGKLSQKLKSGGERHRNSLDLFVPGDDSLAVGQSIDLLDDVLSTGQSIRSGLSVLREMGYVARGVLVMSVRNRVRLQPGGEE